MQWDELKHICEDMNPQQPTGYLFAPISFSLSLFVIYSLLTFGFSRKSSHITIFLLGSSISLTLCYYQLNIIEFFHYVLAFGQNRLSGNVWIYTHQNRSDMNNAEIFQLKPQPLSKTFCLVSLTNYSFELANKLKLLFVMEPKIDVLPIHKLIKLLLVLLCT